MASRECCVTIHMVASLDGYIARKDGRVDWLETSDEFKDGDTLDPDVRTGVPRDDRLLRHGLTYLRDRVGFRDQGIRLGLWR